VATAPATVTVVFTEELASPGSSLEVRDLTNNRVDAGNSQVLNVNPKNTMTIGLKPGLPPGLYTVAWTTLSAADGTTNSGTFSFGVGVPAAPPAAISGQKKNDIAAGPPFDITGSVVSLKNDTMEFVTSDVNGLPTVLKLDASNISKRNISVGETLTLTVGPRQNDDPLIWTVVTAGSYTERADFSPNQDATQNETSSVGNRPDDDEARNKQHHEKGKED
jgi:hypothetical protein